MTTYFAKAIHSVPWDAQEGPHGVPHAGCQIGGDHTTGGRRRSSLTRRAWNRSMWGHGEV